MNTLESKHLAQILYIRLQAYYKMRYTVKFYGFQFTLAVALLYTDSLEYSELFWVEVYLYIIFFLLFPVCLIQQKSHKKKKLLETEA